MKLGLTCYGAPDNLKFHSSASSAVRNARFVQECIPENLGLKHALFCEIEPDLVPEAIVASSALELMLSDM